MDNVNETPTKGKYLLAISDYERFESFDRWFANLAHETWETQLDLERKINRSSGSPLQQFHCSSYIKIQGANQVFQAVGDAMAHYRFKDRSRPVDSPKDDSGFAFRNDGTDQAAASISLKDSCRSAISIAEESLDLVHNELCQVACDRSISETTRRQLHERALQAIELKRHFAEQLTSLLISTRTKPD